MFQIVVLSLVLTWIIAAAILVEDLWSSGVPESAAVANEPVVQEFYDGVNQYLATGITARIEAIVADHMVDQNLSNDFFGDSNSVIEQVETIRRIDHEARISARLTVDLERRVTAVATIQWSEDARSLGLKASGNAGFWPNVEAFSLTGGKIVSREYELPGQAYLQPIMSPRLPVGIESLEFLDADVWLFEVGSADSRVTKGSAEVIAVLNSELELSLSADATQSATILLGMTGESNTSLLAPGVETKVTPGGFVVLPEDITYTLKNTGNMNAYLLTVHGDANQATGYPVSLALRSTFSGKRALGYESEKIHTEMFLNLGSIELNSGGRLLIDPFTLVLIVISPDDGLEISATSNAEKHEEITYVFNGAEGPVNMRLSFIAVGENGAASVVNHGTKRAAGTVLAVTAPNASQ